MEAVEPAGEGELAAERAGAAVGDLYSWDTPRFVSTKAYVIALWQVPGRLVEPIFRPERYGSNSGQLEPESGAKLAHSKASRLSKVKPQ